MEALAELSVYPGSVFEGGLNSRGKQGDEGMRPQLKGQRIKANVSKIRNRTLCLIVSCVYGSSCPPLIPHLKYL